VGTRVGTAVSVGAGVRVTVGSGVGFLLPAVTVALGAAGGVPQAASNNVNARKMVQGFFIQLAFPARGST
jgi:hypothetical protein